MLIDYEFLKHHIVQRGLNHFADPLTVIGLENVPTRGPVILAAKHESMIDTFAIAAVIDRPVYSFAKVEYFQGNPVKREFFERSNAIPVHRDGSSQANTALERGYEVLDEGGIILLHPEGGRSLDGKVYRAKLSFIDMAVTAGVPIVPVGLIGTRNVHVIGEKWFHKASVTIVFGKPIEIHPVLPNPRLKMLEKRHAAKKVMTTIARLSHAEYVDKDLTVVKAARAELLERDGA